MKHRILALLCALTVMISLFPSALALSGDAVRAADTLATLGIVQGSESGDYQLDAPLTRAQAAVLLVRLSGSEAKAAADPQISGHRDLPAWCADYIDYAVNQKWIDEPFQLDFYPQEPMTANGWCSALLHLMGYGEKDFAPADAALFAQRIGLIAQPCKDPLTRGMAIEEALDALRFEDRSGVRLLDRLLEGKPSVRPAANALGLLTPELNARQMAGLHTAAVFAMNCYESSEEVRLHIPGSNSSGFFISPDGLAVTNYHSIQDAMEAEIVLSTGETYPVERVLWGDMDYDLALIRISKTSTTHHTTSAFACLDLIGSKDVRPGDPVFAIGNPLGLGLSVSQGIVSATEHAVEHYKQPCLVNTADISHGSSGGALMDPYGRVLAVTSGAYASGNSMYLAVPVDPILELKLDELGEGKTPLDFRTAEREAHSRFH